MSAFTFDPNAMTFGDLEAFEDITGKAFQVLMAPKPVLDEETGEIKRDKRGKPIKEVQPTAKALVALVYLAGRRSNPGFTLDDARNTKVTSFTVADIEDEDPEKKDD